MFHNMTLFKALLEVKPSMDRFFVIVVVLCHPFVCRVFYIFTKYLINLEHLIKIHCAHLTLHLIYLCNLKLQVCIQRRQCPASKQFRQVKVGRPADQQLLLLVTIFSTDSRYIFLILEKLNKDIMYSMYVQF